MTEIDRIGEVRFPITASVLATIGIILLSAFYWYATKSMAETIVFFAAAVAAAGAILTAFYSARSLAINARYLEREEIRSRSVSEAEERRHRELLEREEARHKSRSALDLASRWNDPSMYHVRLTVRELFDEDHKPPNFLQNLEKNKVNVIHFLNFLEEIAIVIERENADEAILRDAFEGVVSTACSKLHSWIQNYRINRHRPKLWIKLESLNKKWTT